MTFLDIEHRLAKQILRLSTAPDGRDSRPPIKVTQGDLASMLGVSRESVNKQLNAFAREGWINLSRGTISVLNAGALRQLSQ